MEFAKKGAHDDSNYLRDAIQEKIDACEESERKYDAVLLGYGLCGNSVVNLTARSVPLVVPRAHDCCTLFLGSKEKYVKHFGDSPSKQFSAAGYMERGDSYVREVSDTRKRMGWDKSYSEYVEEYGKENARYIWETLHPKEKPWEEDGKLVFIEMPELRHLGYAEQCRRKAQSDDKEFVELEGSIELIEKLIFGEWPEEDFLVVKPKQRIMGVYDMGEIVKAID